MGAEAVHKHKWKDCIRVPARTGIKSSLHSMISSMMLFAAGACFSRVYSGPGAWGPFLERPGNVSGPVSHPVSPRKLFACFSKLPLFSIPLFFPITCPVIYGRSRPPVKLPGSRKCRKTKQNGGRRRTFFVFREDHSHIKDATFLSIWLTARSLNDFDSLEKE